jgi:hypothetical protein
MTEGRAEWCRNRWMKTLALEGAPRRRDHSREAALFFASRLTRSDRTDEPVQKNRAISVHTRWYPFDCQDALARWIVLI